MKTYDYPKGAVEMEVFKMLLEEDSKKVEHVPMSIEDEVVINFWVNPEEVNHIIFRVPLPMNPLTRFSKNFKSTFENCIHGFQLKHLPKEEILQVGLNKGC